MAEIRRSGHWIRDFWVSRLLTLKVTLLPSKTLRQILSKLSHLICFRQHSKADNCVNFDGNGKNNFVYLSIFFFFVNKNTQTKVDCHNHCVGSTPSVSMLKQWFAEFSYDHTSKCSWKFWMAIWVRFTQKNWDIQDTAFADRRLRVAKSRLSY